MFFNTLIKDGVEAYGASPSDEAYGASASDEAYGASATIAVESRYNKQNCIDDILNHIFVPLSGSQLWYLANRRHELS